MSDITPIQALSGTPATAKAAAAKPLDPKAMKAAKDFEGVLLNQVMDQMQATVPDGGLLEDSASKQVQGMFWHFLSQDVADKGGAGMWKDIYRQMAQHDNLPTGGLELPPEVEVMK